MRGMPSRGFLAERGEEMDALFKGLFGSRWMPMLRASALEDAVFAPSADMVEMPTAFEITLELPGCCPDQLKVEAVKGSLTVRGEKCEEHHEGGQTFHRVERRHGKFERKFSFPSAVNEAAISAEFKDGILKIIVPKAEEATPTTITVKT